MENRPVDPGSIQGSHRPISFIRNKHTTRVSILQVLRSINNHIVRLVHKKPYFEVLEMKYRRNTSNEHVWCTTPLAKLSLNHSNGRTHSWRFSTWKKKQKNSYQVRSLVERDMPTKTLLKKETWSWCNPNASLRGMLLHRRRLLKRTHLVCTFQSLARKYTASTNKGSH